MGRKKAPSEAVLTDSTNSAASAQTHAGEHSSQGTHAGKFVPGTFSRKAKAALKQISSTKENAEHTPSNGTKTAVTAASPTLTDFLTPISLAQTSLPEAFLSARTQLQCDVSSSSTSRLGKSGQEEADEPAGEQGGKDRRGNYPRRVAPSRGEQQGAAHAAYMARMAAHFAEVDDFDLTVDSPSAAGPRSPDLAPQPAVQTAAPPAEAFAADHTDSDSAPASESLPNAVSARTAQWLDAIPSPGTQLDEGASGPAADRGSAAESATAEAAHAGMHDSNQENAPAADGSQTGACSRAARIAEGPSAAVSAETEGSRLTLTAPEEEEPCDGEEDAPEEDSSHIPLAHQPRRSSMAGRVSHKGRPSLAHARKSIVGAQLQQLGGQDAHQKGQRRSSVYEALSSRLSLSQGLSRVSLGLTGALNRLSLGPSASRRDSVTQAKGQNVHAESLQGAALLDCKKRAISPIAESPEVSGRDTSATPEAISLVADASTLQAAQPEAQALERGVTEGLSEQLDAKLRVSEEANVEPDQAAVPEQVLTPLQLLLKLCDQETDVEALPSMEQMLSQHVKLRTVKKIGEGTFGEAFKGGDVVFKIVPMEGDLLVNGESQKKAEEITAEVAIALTLSQLHPEAGVAAHNSTQGFVQTHSAAVCRGRYASSLVREWHAWDKRNGSENDPVDAFGDDQLFVIFVVANGGADLEHFEVHSFEEARSIILQTVLALAVAEEAVQFEHRDLHWGNLLIKRVPAGQRIACTLRGVDIVADSHGVQITLIDFTLSRLCTIDGSGAYCDLDADPELFQGPKGDCQADTYRRMRKATKGKWEGFHPATNALWMHYLADTLLNLKAFPLEPSQKKRLRDFRKRALSGQSCSDLLMDEFLKGSWLAGGK